MSSTIKIAALVLAAAFGSLPAAAQRPVDETRDARADARITISNIAGSVTVAGWDREQVQIRGTLSDGVDRLDITGDAAALDIEVVYEKHLQNIEGSDLTIQVPAGARVEVNTISAEVGVTKLTDRLSVSTISGEVDVAGDLDELRAKTVSGEIMLRGRASDLEVQTVSGDIDLGDLKTTELRLNTVSGDADLVAGTLERFQFNSVSGDLEFTGMITRSGSFNSQSGELSLTFTGEPDAEFSVSTFSGDIDNGFGPKPEKKSKWTPGLSLRFTSGSGAASIDIESFSGDVVLQKR